MKIIVTGGAGFIGSHLVERLVKDSHEVVVIDNLSCGNIGNLDKVIDKITFVESELSVYGAWVDHLIGAKWVFHLAALSRIQPSFEDPILHDDATVRSTLNLMIALKDKNIDALVVSSSSSIYGDPDKFPTSENEKIDPLSPYALQKYAEERYAHILGDRYSIPVTSLRYFNVYGPRSYDENNTLNAYSSVVGIFSNQKKSGGKLTITGEGQQKRDFIHVSDVVNANLTVASAIKYTNGESYNVGTGEIHSILDLAKMFDCRYSFIDERKGEAEVTYANIDKLKSIGWFPSVNLLAAINEGNI